MTEAARKLAVILHADVVGSTQLVKMDEALAHQRMRDAFRRLSIIIDEHGGVAHEVRGDALVAEFGKASDAIGASLAFQHDNTVHNDGLDDDVRVTLRIGIAMGEVVVADGTVTGEGVVLAQRLEQLAEPGNVYVQGAVYDTVPKRLPYLYQSLGERELKGFDEPVRVYQVEQPPARDTNTAEQNTTVTRVREQSSIAVLPFTNMSGDPEQEYFSDGITEDIITELSRFRNLFVISRNSSFTFKDQAVDVTEVGAKLGVTHIVEGSVRKSGNRARVTAQLIDVVSGNHLWAERYDRNLEDIFTVQDEVVAAVVAQLGLSLREAATARARGAPTGSLTAYEHFLRGRAAWWHGNWNEGFEHLDRALTADPAFAAAHAWLALQYAYQTYGATMDFSPALIVQKTREHAEAALALDDRDPFVHMAASMAFGFSPRPDKDRGLHHSDVSVRLNPHDFDTMFCRAYNVSFFGRHEEALEWLERARRLNPVATFMLSECYSDTYYMMREYEKSLDSYKGQGEAPTHVQATFAACHAQLGQVEQARICVKQIERTCPPNFDLAALANAQIVACARSEDAEHWRDGYRKAGIQVPDIRSRISD